MMIHHFITLVIIMTTDAVTSLRCYQGFEVESLEVHDCGANDKCTNGNDKFGVTNQWSCGGHAAAFPVLSEEENDGCKVSYRAYGPSKTKNCACKTDYCNYPASQPDFKEPKKVKCYLCSTEHEWNGGKECANNGKLQGYKNTTGTYKNWCIGDSCVYDKTVFEKGTEIVNRACFYSAEWQELGMSPFQGCVKEKNENFRKNICYCNSEFCNSAQKLSYGIALGSTMVLLFYKSL